MAGVLRSPRSWRRTSAGEALIRTRRRNLMTMKNTILAFVLSLSAAALLFGFQAGRAAASETRPGIEKISIQDLKSRLGSADLLVIDVRDPVAWSAAETKIQGAVREDPRDVDSWVGNCPRDKAIVLYCS